MTYTRSQILENRRKAVEYLQRPHLRKATGVLQQGRNSRCCLGHMCYALDIPSEKVGNYTIKYDGQEWEAPQSLVDKLGLFGAVGEWYNFGVDEQSRPSNFLGQKASPDHINTSLAALNDDTRTSPQRIGAWLEKYIEGGPGTPFRPLSDYSE